MKYIKKLNENINLSKLDTSTNMIFSMLRLIDKDFEWVSKFYNKG